MKLVIYILILISFQALKCTSSEKNNCNQYKNGNFEYRSNGFVFEIKRKDSIQTEINKKTGENTKNSIKWITDNRYELRMLESSAVYPDSINKLRKNSTITVFILSCTDNYYVYKSQSDNTNRVLIDTLWISH